MSDPVSIGLNRAAIGRGWTDLLDNQIAMMEVLANPNQQTREALRFRINETKKFLASLPSSQAEADLLKGVTPAGPNTA